MSFDGKVALVTGAGSGMGQAAAVAAIAQAVVARFGRLDMAHNNAGISPRARNIVECTTENWDAILGVNLTGVWPDEGRGAGVRDAGHRRELGVPGYHHERDGARRHRRGEVHGGRRSRRRWCGCAATERRS